MSNRRFTLLIRGGIVFDGSGKGPVKADVGVIEDKIAYVGDASSAAADTVIDASGLAVSPGFVDAHAHSEFTTLSDPRVEGKLYQGVTTEISGNCGLSAAPLLGGALAQREEDLKTLAIEERWSTFNEYFELLEKKGLSINFATLAGHGNIRASVMGYEDRPPGVDEMERMKGLLGDALTAGAIGLSTGLIYPPGAYAGTGEIAELAKSGAQGSSKPFIYASHMRGEGDGLLDAIRETISIGRVSGSAVHISHIKTAGRENWNKVDDAISLIEEARAEGVVTVTCDRYPYTAASTGLDTLLPDWTYEGGVLSELKRLSDPETRKRIISEIQKPDDYWSETVFVSDVARPESRWMEGKSMADIAAEMGKPPVQALIDLLVAERLRVGAIFHSMSEDNLRRFLSLPYVMVGSDGSARSTDGPTRTGGGGKPHPRGFGTFPRFIGGYARTERLMPLEKAIRKVTSLPCATFGLKNRGLIKECYIADIAVFEPDGIIDTATYESPWLLPKGIRSVIVNGTPVLLDGAPMGGKERPGRVLRHGI